MRDKILFRLKDEINHPCFRWPETLLRFPAPELPPECLIDNNGRLYNTQVCGKDIYFISGLESGEEKTFEAYEGGREPGIVFEEKSDCYSIDNSKLVVKIPKSGNADGVYADAPVKSISRAGKEYGSNRFYFSGVSRTETVIEECGRVFVKAAVLYYSGGELIEKSTVTVVYGYDFITVKDEIFTENENAYMEYEWTGFEARQWYATTWPDSHWSLKGSRYGSYNWRSTEEKIIIPYNGEDPYFSDIPDDDKALAVRLGPYMPFFAYSVRPQAAFWSENGESLGFFVADHDGWDEGDYPVWGTGTKLDGRFYANGGRLTLRLAMQGKQRSIAICAYDRSRDEEWFSELEAMADKICETGVSREEAVKLTCYPTTYTAFLHNRYTTLNLDRVKEWQLTYDGKCPDIPFDFEKSRCKSSEELKRAVFSGGRVAIATKGIEEFHDRPYTFEAVEMRQLQSVLADGYVHFAGQLSEADRRTVTALMLVSIYVCAGEECIPMKKMLGGHPNFLSDVKSAAGLGAALFPEHRDAQRFADVFEDFICRNTKYHIRPDVPAWEAKGGRWTEAIGIYTWAFLTPAVKTNYLIKNYYDGRDRMANERIAELASWIVNILTPPLNGRRCCPPQGAHSELRVPFAILGVLAESVEQIDPVLAENMRYLVCENDRHEENTAAGDDVWSFMYRFDDKPSRAPIYRSAKYTGYGIILRTDPNTSDECAVYMQQIDKGPNYRWGLPAQGSCGVIYYYKNGRGLSYNGKEDAGDRKSEDTAYCTNFGVWKDGMYKSIGMNELSEPVMELGSVQYASLMANPEYSAPEYISRSVLMLPEYIVIYDAVSSAEVPTRFSWFVKKEEKYPFLHFARGIVFDRFAVKNYAVSEHITPQSKGMWFEGNGDSLCLVSEGAADVEDTEWGMKVNGCDFIFADRRGVSADTGEVNFKGSMGFYRRDKLFAVIGKGYMKTAAVEISVGSGAVSVKAENGTAVAHIKKGSAVSISYKGKAYSIREAAADCTVDLESGAAAEKEKVSFRPAEFERNTVYTQLHGDRIPPYPM